MTGSSLPASLDLIDLAQTDSNIFVIVEGGGDAQTGPPITRTTQRPDLSDITSVTFTSGRSYLRLDRWSPGHGGRVEFNFRTIQRDGVMMVSRTSSDRSDFFAVELSDGDLYVLVNRGGQTQRFLVAAGVNDGQPHHVIIELTGRSISFSVDGDRHHDRLRSDDCLLYTSPSPRD